MTNDRRDYPTRPLVGIGVVLAIVVTMRRAQLAGSATTSHVSTTAPAERPAPQPSGT